MEYKEILKLKEMLDKANIPTTIYNYEDGYIVILNENTYAYEYQGTWHGPFRIEIMGCLTDEEYEYYGHDGYCWLSTAEEVFKRFKYCYEYGTTTYDKYKNIGGNTNRAWLETLDNKELAEFLFSHMKFDQASFMKWLKEVHNNEY